MKQQIWTRYEEIEPNDSEQRDLDDMGPGYVQHRGKLIELLAQTDTSITWGIESRTGDLLVADPNAISYRGDAQTQIEAALAQYGGREIEDSYAQCIVFHLPYRGSDRQALIRSIKRIAARSHMVPRSRGGTAPNASVVLTEDELRLIEERFGGSKSSAIHAGLARLANGE